MAIISEDYVSFEIAKLLKEKGFNGLCNAYYDCFTTNNFHNGCEPTDFNSIDTRIRKIVSAPTLQMAMKWLREMPKIAYNIFIFADGGDSGLLEYIYEIQEIDNELMHVNGSLDTNNSRYESYEEACEAAIKYCLENLI